MGIVRGSMRGRAEALIWQCLDWSPLEVLNAVDAARRTIDPYRERRLPITLFKDRESLNDGTILLVGRGSGLESFAVSLCGEDGWAHRNGEIAATNVVDQISSLSKGVNLVVCRLPRRHGDSISDSFAFRSPCLVRSMIELPLDPKTRKQVRKSQRRNIKKIEDNGLDFLIGDKVEDLEIFHNEYYLPYKTWRFGDDATDLSFHRIRYLYRRGGRIFWIVRNGRPIAGNLLLSRGGVLEQSLLGVLDGDFDHVRAGALSAGYHFLPLWAEAQGFQRLDLGLAKSRLNDEILTTKRRWGGSLDSQANSRFEYVIHWEDCTPLIIRFLHDRPLIFQDSDGLSGLTALPGDETHTIDDVMNVARRYWMDGLKRLIIVTPSHRDIVLRGSYPTIGSTIWITRPGNPTECVTQAVPLVDSSS